MKSTYHVQRVHVHEVFCFLLVAALIANVVPVHCNSEGDTLNLWKTQLVDPNNELQSWDPTLHNPCTWLHVTCNGENRVTRVDLGSAGLSGTLTPQLGSLSYLQYFEVFDNKLYGSIPKELGNLKNLVSLDLYQNQLNGSIPNTLGDLKSLRFVRLNNNKLTGKLPTKLISLIFWGRLTILDVSNNQLDGTVHSNANATVTTIIRDPKA